MNIVFPSADEIIPGLFIGNFAIALSKDFIQKNKIALIVNCTPHLPNMHPNLANYANIPVNDSSNDDETMYNSLHFIMPKLRLYLTYGKNILVHCSAGKSRSASIVAGYLIKYYGYSVDDAIRLIRKKRPKAFDHGRNVVFRKALDKFQATLRNEI